MKTIYFKNQSNLFAISFSKTRNEKIADKNTTVVQTYTFSLAQFELVLSGEKFTMQEFFKLDKSNCLDCPFSGNVRATDITKTVGCYTHKFMQYNGFISMLKSAKNRFVSVENIPYLSEDIAQTIVAQSAGKYVRFGTYGEPSLLPFNLVKSMAQVAKSYTGYTHQGTKIWAQKYADYFMASVHGPEEISQNWRSFIAKDAKIDVPSAVICPASKEAGYKSTCAKCGLCSGLLGKGKKDIVINVH